MYSRSFLTVLLFARSLIWISSILTLTHFFGISVNTTLLFVGVLCGVLIGDYLGNLPLTTLGGITLYGLTIVGIWITSALLAQIPLPSAVNLLEFAIFLDLIRVPISICLIASFNTWILKRWEGIAIIEIVSFIVATAYALSSHQQLNLDRPKLAIALAWQLNIDAAEFFILTGGILLIITLLHLAICSSFHQINNYYSFKPIKYRSPSKDDLLLSSSTLNYSALFTKEWWKAFCRQFVAVIVLALIIILISFSFYQTLSLKSGGQLTNGVGSGKAEEGKSPLGFHSALGATKEPAAIVRLDSDYSSSPFSPMLYIRESALSQLGGREMVVANERFDTDIPKTSINLPFQRAPNKNLIERIKVDHSIFLLSSQDNPFAIDYPIQISPIINPSPNRFVGAYRAQSLAPTYNYKTLSNMPVGDPFWSAEERSHYTAPHPDLRYAEKAKTIVGALLLPIDQARAIVNYLSKHATYTLQPNHDVQDNDDPVLPFLFGDLRGYCVHFAHATVYMLRSLGIPSRIATGFMTDLSQSKDGHILLRMSDRHAWAEIYVQRIGWVPFDTQPEQVESHADTQVDSKILDELMGLLEPSNDILPSQDNESEKEKNLLNFTLKDIFKYGVTFFSTLLSLVIVTKIMLWYGWRIFINSERKAKWMYYALLARYLDSGLIRNWGETRLEFTQRITATIRERFNQLPHLDNNWKMAEVLSTYANYLHISPADRATQYQLLTNTFTKDITEWRNLPLYFRLAAIVRLRSVVAFFTHSIG